MAAGDYITSVAVCASWDNAHREAIFGLTFTSHLGPSNMAVGGTGYPGQCENTAAVISGTSAGASGGALLYLSGAAPGTVLSSLCFQWNVSP